MRRVILLLTMMVATLVVAGGVALAVNKIGTDGPDTLQGTNEHDTLNGKGGDDVLLALTGNDTLLGGSVAEPLGGHKTIVGGDGNDVFNGGLDPDTMVGEDGNDFFYGGDFEPSLAKDTFSSGAGNDVLDVINKPAGKDVVTCGGGVDRVLADRADVVAANCERVFAGLRKIDAYRKDIPESFWEGLPPPP
ncbi:MAG TPA: calcium-binding protein [Rubrobacteraceae bacterium]|nr:calcium-binding protein [Rubrobacteraceae bacterium]